jgi:hypothetical protein
VGTAPMIGVGNRALVRIRSDDEPAATPGRVACGTGPIGVPLPNLALLLWASHDLATSPRQTCCPSELDPREKRVNTVSSLSPFAALVVWHSDRRILWIVLEAGISERL